MIRINKTLGLGLLTVGVIIFGSISFWGFPHKPKTPDTTFGTENAKEGPKPVVPVSQGRDFNEEGIQDISSLPTLAIWKKLLAGFHDGEKVQIDLENALIERLRQEPGGAIYKEYLSLFRQGSLASFAQQVLISLLGEVGNYQAAEVLMQLILTNLLVDPDVKLTAVHTIGKFSPESWQEHSNAELAPVFESAWQTENPEFWPAIANVLASIGTPSTLEIFMKTLAENNNPQRVAVVKQAMTNLVNPSLIPKLADALDKPANGAVRQASSIALANMGVPEAASALLDWAAHSKANRLNMVKPLFETVFNTTPEFIGYLDNNLAQRKFASNQVKQAITSVLADVKKGLQLNQ